MSLKINKVDRVPATQQGTLAFGKHELDQSILDVLNGDTSVIEVSDGTDNTGSVKARIMSRIRAASVNGHPSAQRDLQVNERSSSQSVYISLR